MVRIERPQKLAGSISDDFKLEIRCSKGSRPSDVDGFSEILTYFNLLGDTFWRSERRTG